MSLLPIIYTPDALMQYTGYVKIIYDASIFDRTPLSMKEKINLFDQISDTHWTIVEEEDQEWKWMFYRKDHCTLIFRRIGERHDTFTMVVFKENEVFIQENNNDDTWSGNSFIYGILRSFLDS
jgi:hypothetical protein